MFTLSNIKQQKCDTLAQQYLFKSVTQFWLRLVEVIHRCRRLLGAPHFLLFHAFSAALAYPQGHFSQQGLGQRGHCIRQLAPRHLTQQGLGEGRHGISQLGAVASGESICRTRSPVLKFPVAQKAAGVHRLHGKDNHMEVR